MERREGGKKHSGEAIDIWMKKMLLDGWIVK